MDAAAYERDGVVCVRGALKIEWIEQLGEAVDRAVDSLSARGHILSQPAQGFFNDVYLSLAHPSIAAFVQHSGIADLVGAALRASSVRFFHDHLFVKQAHCPISTPWHHDQPFWPVSGGRYCSIWAPLDPVTSASSSLEFVRGSHRWPDRRSTPSRQAKHRDSGGSTQPAESAFAHLDRDRAGLDIVTWDLNPGDVIVFDPLAVHGSGPNTTEICRRALSTRWFTGDVRYSPDHRTAPLPDGHGLSAGEPLAGPMFPDFLL